MTSHAHHWRIAPNDGPYSAGVCRGCGTTRTFGNSSEAIEELRATPHQTSWHHTKNRGGIANIPTMRFTTKGDFLR